MRQYEGSKLWVVMNLSMYMVLQVASYNLPPIVQMSQSRFNSRDTPRRTPIQSRSYLNNMPHLHQSPHNYSGSHTPRHYNETNSLNSDEHGLIYGTNISSKQVMNALQRFVLEFEVLHSIGGQTVAEKTYHNQLNELETINSTIFEVKGIHLKEHDRELYYQFIYFPAQMISCFDAVLKTLFDRFFVLNSNSETERAQRLTFMEQLMMGIKYLDELSHVKDLGPSNINRLISVRGIVIRTSEVYPEMKKAYFVCTHCQSSLLVQLDNAKVQEPNECSHCKRKHTLELIHNHCQFTDKQYVKFQELPEYVPEGETPHSLTIISYDMNVDGMRPGDRVEVVGIFRANPVKVQRVKSNVKSVFNTYIDLISYRVLEENRFRSESSEQVFSDDERNKFISMASEETIIDNLVQSFAPSIFGHPDIKKGILAQLFGGSKKDFGEVGRGRFRSDINICLVGDPSTAKSQLLQQVYKIAPRGIYTSGRGSSAVGLTANVRKDPETREFILESGALVLSDLGICCIDEFDKMDQNSRTILLEAMEQQTISIAKAGIVCQLNSRTAILAAANPIHSKYDRKKSVVENINLPPALLSRFDLIYIMLDVASESNDKMMAQHLLDLYSDQVGHQPRPTRYSRDVLAKYISYARQYCNPVLSEQAGNRLMQVYTEMRQLGNNKKLITATPRQLESLIRLSESFAKMRMSNQVSLSDVDDAVHIMKEAIKQSATDPVTGLIDMDIIATGRTANSKQKVVDIANKARDIMKANFSKYQRTSYVENFLAEYQKQHSNQERVSLYQMMQALRLLQTEDVLVLFGQGKVSFKLQKDMGSL